MTELTKKIEILERALKREKSARRLAEAILERKSSELFDLSQALQDSNSQLQELLSEQTSELEGVFLNIADPYLLIDMKGYVLKMNDAASKMLGVNLDQGTFNVRPFIAEGQHEYNQKAFKKLIQSGFYGNYIVDIVTNNDSHKKLQINASLIYKNGHPIAIQGIARDITEETRLKELLEEHRIQLNIIVDNYPMGIGLIDLKTNQMVITNQALCCLMERTSNELKDVDIDDLLNADEDETVREFKEKLKRSETATVTVEKKQVGESGKISWLKTLITSVKANEKEITHLVVTIEDITEEKEAKEKLKESENRLSTLILNLQTGILLENENREILLVNKQFCNMFSIPVEPEILFGMDCSNSANESKGLFKEPEQFVTRIAELLEKQEVSMGEELELADGRIFERSYIPIYLDGVYKGHLWKYNDVTYKQRYQRNLQSQKEKYSNIIANMNLGLVEADTHGKILYANNSFCEMTGYVKDELCGNNVTDILMPESEVSVLQHLKDREQGVADSYEVKIRTKSGRKRYWLNSAAPNFDNDGKIIGSIAIQLDITQRKKLESQKEKLLENLESQNEQLNEYAHIVSHDLKSPLRNISALLDWTMEDFQEKLGEESLQNLKLMQGKVEKMDHLIGNILNYSSIERGRLTSDQVDLNDVIREILELVFIPDHISVNTITKLPTIAIDKTRIQQVFQNLISNAINYNDKEKGLIEIGYLSDDTHHIFSVKDNGVGIAEEHHEKIFKIFNTLGNHEASTGIGLNIVKKVVDLYHGKIWLDSELSKGTTFYFSIKK
ncbi:PAS domain S-box protein [uncultured Sunxiuqinia sp.]|uniref:PAS domain-containing sensor histidine kinase n=1 Tax=uncultured Sunxiuqinia sp. TaxID=1573825 RepID=UPI002AA8000A|nr:PAS domain S-box protein [uncultured Sunxiuqinia sp.]